MAGITATTHWVTATTAFSSGRVYAALAGWALLLVVLFVALFLAVRAGDSTRATSLPIQELVQQTPVIDQAPEPGSVRGRPS